MNPAGKQVKGSSLVVRVSWKKIKPFTFEGTSTVGRYELTEVGGHDVVVNFHPTNTVNDKGATWHFSTLAVAKKACGLHAAKLGFEARDRRLAREAREAQQQS